MKILSITILTFLLTFSLKATQSADTLKVAYTSAPPFIIVDNYEAYGVALWLWEKVAEELEQPYQLIAMDFEEMLDGLESGVLDVSINPLTITSDRMNTMAFTLPFYSSNTTVAVKSASRLSQIRNFLSAIFNINFLRVIGGLLFLIGIFGFAVWLFERKKNPDQFRKGPKGIWDGLWWSAVTMTTVGYGDKAPVSRGGKFIALIWMFSGLIFISGFTASIASILTVYNLSTEISELNDFKEKSIGTVVSTGTQQFLKYNFFKDIHTFPNLTESLDALQMGSVEAIIYDQPILNYSITHSPKYNQIKILPLSFNPQYYAFALSNEHVELQNAISKAIIRNIESNEWQMVLNEYGCGEQ